MEAVIGIILFLFWLMWLGSRATALQEWWKKRQGQGEAESHKPDSE